MQLDGGEPIVVNLLILLLLVEELQSLVSILRDPYVVLYKVVKDAVKSSLLFLGQLVVLLISFIVTVNDSATPLRLVLIEQMDEPKVFII